jgi:hypothetical protein
MRHSDDLKILAGALGEFHKDVPQVLKDSEGQFKNSYASLGAIVHAVGPKLAEQGLSVVQVPSGTSEDPTLVTILLHVSGQFIESEAPLMLEKSNAQGQGSAITYMRRYAYCAALGVVADEDDDGAAASTKSRKSEQTPAEQKFRAMDPPEEPDPDAITSPQVNKIRIQLRDLGMSEGTDLVKAFQEHCPGQDWPELGLHGLTKVQASALIDGLK